MSMSNLGEKCSVRLGKKTILEYQHGRAKIYPLKECHQKLRYVGQGLTEIIAWLREQNVVDPALLKRGSLDISGANNDFAFLVATRY